MEVLITTVAPLFVLCLLLSMSIAVGCKFHKASPAIVLLGSMCFGAALLFAVFSKIESITGYPTQWSWVDFVGVVIMLGAMNNGNVRGETTPLAKELSTWTFFGVFLMSILMFWL